MTKYNWKEAIGKTSAIGIFIIGLIKTDWFLVIAGFVLVLIAELEEKHEKGKN